MPRSGESYEVTVTIKAGFSLGEYYGLVAGLSFAGQGDCVAIEQLTNKMIGKIPIPQDHQIIFKCINRSILGVDAIGATFRFGSLDVGMSPRGNFMFILLRFNSLIDEQLMDETDFMGVNPSNLGGINLTLRRWTPESSHDRDIEKGADIPGIWDAKKVDHKNFKKHGISYNTRYDN